MCHLIPCSLIMWAIYLFFFPFFLKVLLSNSINYGKGEYLRNIIDDIRFRAVGLDNRSPVKQGENY
jgi:hypothetical protein